MYHLTEGSCLKSNQAKMVDDTIPSSKWFESKWLVTEQTQGTEKYFDYYE